MVLRTPSTQQTHSSTPSTQSTRMGLLGLAIASITLGLQTGEAIATPNFVPRMAQAAPTDSGDIIIDGGSPTPNPGTPNPGTSNPGTANPSLGNTRFLCQISNGQHTVMYQPESQPGRTYPWAVPSAMGGGWDNARRCNEITRRLEAYRPDGLLEMRTGMENGYNTICVTTQRVPGCRIVLTVPPGQDPILTRDRVFQNLTIADSGQSTQGVTTFTNNTPGGIIGEVSRWLNLGGSRQPAPTSYSGGINLRPFLDRADGGTGQYLQGGATPGRQLNPNRFR